LARKPVFGACRICGIEGKLSYEHVPPRAAFNDRPILLRTGFEIINSDLDDVKSEKRQRGSGDYTLCPKCNNLTGKWYGSAFVDWVYQGMKILHYTKRRPSIYYNFHIFPLRVIKQVVSMFFSANGPEFRDAYPDLVKFVLNKETRFLDEKYSIYAYYKLGDRSRQLGLTVGTDLAKGKISRMSEIAYPPIGYMITFNSQPPDQRLLDITFFSRYQYHDWKPMPLRMPTLPIHTHFPGDYRDRDTVLQQRAEDIKNYGLQFIVIFH
jgi:hypothetical protein